MCNPVSQLSSWLIAIAKKEMPQVLRHLCGSYSVFMISHRNRRLHNHLQTRHRNHRRHSRRHVK